MCVNAVRDFESNHFTAKVTTGIDQRSWDLAIFDDELLAVDILQKKIQGHDALAEAGLDAGPFGLRQDAGNQVKGEEAFGAAAVAIDGESDALQEEAEVGVFATVLELGREP